MLPRPIEYRDGSELTRATGYRGARALLEQKPDLVPTNIESLTLIILGEKCAEYLFKKCTIG